MPHGSKPNQTAPQQIEKHLKFSLFLTLSFLDCFQLSFSVLSLRFSPLLFDSYPLCKTFQLSAKKVARKEACNMRGREASGDKGE